MLKKSEERGEGSHLKIQKRRPHRTLGSQVPGSFPLAELLPSHDAKPQVPERQN